MPSCFLFLPFTLTTQWLQEKLNNTTIFTPKKCGTYIHIHLLFCSIPIHQEAQKEIIVVTTQSHKCKAGKDLQRTSKSNPTPNSMVEET
jgi:plasmid rolling circle replication initiator protein Rep